MSTAHIKPEKSIRFSNNWNGKLQNHFFTTIRLHSDYYRVGDYYQVWQREKELFPSDNKPSTKSVYAFKGLLWEKKVIRLDQLPAITAALDTGYPLAETKEILRRFYPAADWSTQLLDILLIQNIEWAL